MLRFVGDQESPAVLGQPGRVSPQRPVRREHEPGVGTFEGAAGSVEAADRSTGGEALDLALPVAEERGRADDESWSGGLVGELAVEMQGDQGDRLAETHVVCEAGAEAERGHPDQPAEAAQLVVAQCRLQCGGGVDRFVGVFGVGDLGAEVVEPAGRGDGDLLAVELGGAGERGAQGVDRGDGFEDAFAGLAGEIGVDQHPLVAQPDHRAGRLGELVHLRLGQRVIAQGNLPAEVEGRVAAEELRHVGRRFVLGGDRGSGGEFASEAAWPVQVDARRRQPLSTGREQPGDVLVGQVQAIRYCGVEQPVERRPDACRSPDRERRVDARSRAEPGDVLSPDVTGIGDKRRVIEAVQLNDRPEPERLRQLDPE